LAANRGIAHFATKDRTLALRIEISPAGSLDAGRRIALRIHPDSAHGGWYITIALKSDKAESILPVATGLDHYYHYRQQ
jgi:hypothetical protein